jgi:hypothetical protein
LTCGEEAISLVPNMRSIGAAKHFILAFALALVGYASLYHLIEWRRARNGPWQVAFTTDAAGCPRIVIDQRKLQITNVQVGFPRQSLRTGKEVEAVAPTNAPSAVATTSAPSLPTTMVFDQPRQVPYEVPFGRCVFMDTTFLPGTLTFTLCGHVVELLPRVLIIDHQQHPWTAGATYQVNDQGISGKEKP